MARAGVLLALGVFAAVAACNEKIELDGLTVIPEFSEPICGGTLEKMERRLDWLVEVTGVPRADRPIKLYWTRHIDTEKCGQRSSCTDRRGRIYSTLEGFTHELVHGHLNRFEYQRPWLAEGLAFMLEDGINSPPSAFASPAELLAVQRAGELDYFAAGNFVRVLRETYGMERLMRLYALSEDTTHAEAKRAFASALGESFDEVSESYATPYTVWRIGSPDCDYPEMERDGDTWRRRFHGECDDPDSIGPYFGPWPGFTPQLTTSAVFETEEAGTYVATAAGTDINVTVTSCDLSAQLSKTGSDVEVALFLEPGRHRVTVRVDLDAPQDVDVVVQPQVFDRAPP
ncbi:hypothetical protein [Nannocystis sp. SCPEA4]|uniref:hypothetical protein n=1 Tax=Nannocystis sp. SCPEA4 TaxID=2996787 RepID=UPI002271C920|nr:hypothetical protein [Nannocystis sp. SCPEA4]MCY1055979.1 hypothetical protein [Nannocystis sp. SCPEA4]